MGMGTLKSTLPRDGTLKKDLSSSISEHHSEHFEYTETKIDLAAETTNEKLPTVQEETQLDNGVSNPLARVDSQKVSTNENQDEVIVNPAISEHDTHNTSDPEGSPTSKRVQVSDNIIENLSALDESHESRTNGEKIESKKDITVAKEENMVTDSTVASESHVNDEVYTESSSGGVTSTKSKDEETTL